MRRLMVPALVLLLALAAGPAAAFEGKPKFGPDAVPLDGPTICGRRRRGLLEAQRLLRAAVHLERLLGGERGHGGQLRARAAGRGGAPIVTQSALLEAVGDRSWAGKGAEEGDGVTFAQFVAVLEESLQRYGIADYEIEVIRPSDASASSLAEVRRALAANELEGRPHPDVLQPGRAHRRLGRPASRRSALTTRAPIRR